MDTTAHQKWISPTDAYNLCKLVHGVLATRERVIQSLPLTAVEWGTPTRGRDRLLKRTAKKVDFAEYLRVARHVAEAMAREAQERNARSEARASGTRSNRIEELERRIAALEAAFDSLLGSSKEVA